MRAIVTAGVALERQNVAGYNCFGNETKFITSEGLRSFSDYKHGDKVTVITHKGNWKIATVKNYGKKELFTFTFRKGKSEKNIKSYQ